MRNVATLPPIAYVGNPLVKSINLVTSFGFIFDRILSALRICFITVRLSDAVIVTLPDKSLTYGSSNQTLGVLRNLDISIWPGFAVIDCNGPSPVYVV